MTAPTGPLAGLRVVEMRGMGPGPFCGMLLADMGAEIVCVSPPGAPPLDPRDPLMRGRTTLSLDLKSPEGRDRLLAIVAKADVVIEGFRPGVMERLGLGPDACLALNPRLVYGRMTGWGQDGPLAQAPGHDPNYIALTGALSTIGYPDRPPVQPLALVGDFGGGALYLATGILAALLSARETGKGQVVDAAIVDGAASLMSAFYGLNGVGHWSKTRRDNVYDGAAPFGTVYETADGGYVAVVPLEPKFYAAFLQALGLDPAELPDRNDKANWPALRERFAAVFRTRTRDEWAKLEAGDGCITPVLDMDEAPRHPHNLARGVFVETANGPLPGPAPRFSATPSKLAGDGARADQLLKAWGL
jgi:alpha-methylacyl-CoA racemase